MSSQVKSSSCSLSSLLEEAVVQLSIHAHRVTTAVEIAVRIVVTKALSTWSANTEAIRSKNSCSSEILVAA